LTEILSPLAARFRVEMETAMRSQSAIAEPGLLTCADPAEIRAHLERVESSAQFAGAPRLARFLSFVVETSLAGQADQIKESLIAVEVYRRSPDYNPQIDSTVRVEAGRLRARLRQYYETNPDDRIRISLPKGGYVPLFECVPAPEPPAVEVPVAAVAPARRPEGARRLWPAVAVLFGVCAIAALAWTRVHSKPPGVESVAVLPFVTLGGDPATERFCDGLTEEKPFGSSRCRAHNGGEVQAARRCCEPHRKRPRRERCGAWIGSKSRQPDGGHRAAD
jgi:hypothetical protein